MIPPYLSDLRSFYFLIKDSHRFFKWRNRNSTSEHKLTHTGPETHWISAELPAQSAYQTFIQPLFARLYWALKENSRIETEKELQMLTGDSENSKSPKEYYSQELQDRRIKGEGIMYEKYFNLQSFPWSAVVKAARPWVLSFLPTPHNAISLPLMVFFGKNTS